MLSTGFEISCRGGASSLRSRRGYFGGVGCPTQGKAIPPRRDRTSRNSGVYAFHPLKTPIAFEFSSGSLAKMNDFFCRGGLHPPTLQMWPRLMNLDRGSRWKSMAVHVGTRGPGFVKLHAETRDTILSIFDRTETRFSDRHAVTMRFQ